MPGFYAVCKVRLFQYLTDYNILSSLHIFYSNVKMSAPSDLLAAASDFDLS